MADHSDQHILAYKTLLAVLAGLFCLTGITVWVSTIDMGIWNVWISLAIASSKATLVLLFFMHLRYEKFILTGMFLITLFFLVLLIGFMFWDVAYR